MSGNESSAPESGLPTVQTADIEESGTRSRFDRDTTLRQLAPDRYGIEIDRGWWIARGPNGGYIAALLLRAMQLSLDDAARKPRSLNIHYATPVAEGPAEFFASVERSGRSASTVTARMMQGERLCAVATGAFSKPRESVAFCDLVMPRSKRPEECESPFPTNADAAEAAEMGLRDRYESRHAIGPPLFQGGNSAHSGGWIRLTEQRPIDALLVAALTDAWPPAMFVRVPPDEQMRGVPTIDLTIHFRADLDRIRLPHDTWCLVHFRTHCAAEGFIEEDGEVWSPDGTLLAQSRQLAVLM